MPRTRGGMGDTQILEQHKTRGGVGILRRPGYKEDGIKKIKDDKHIYADDVILKATETKRIYGELESFEKAGEYHGVGINWGKIEILTRAMDREIRELRKSYQKI